MSSDWIDPVEPTDDRFVDDESSIKVTPPSGGAAPEPEPEQAPTR